MNQRTPTAGSTEVPALPEAHAKVPRNVYSVIPAFAGMTEFGTSPRAAPIFDFHRQRTVVFSPKLYVSIERFEG
jgi:hypothetical protein